MARETAPSTRCASLTSLSGACQVSHYLTPSRASARSMGDRMGDMAESVLLSHCNQDHLSNYSTDRGSTKSGEGDGSAAEPVSHAASKVNPCPRRRPGPISPPISRVRHGLRPIPARSHAASAWIPAFAGITGKRSATGPIASPAARPRCAPAGRACCTGSPACNRAHSAACPNRLSPRRAALPGSAR